MTETQHEAAARDAARVEPSQPSQPSGEPGPGAGNAPARVPAGALAWAISVAGWLICAGLCLWLTIALEAWPYAYEVFFPAVLLILFCNILVFLFVTTRWGGDLRRLFGSVVRVCIGEGLLLLIMYAAGRYGIGA